MQETTENQKFYDKLTEVLTASDQFKPEYRHLDSVNFTQFPLGESIIVASRPFSNINVLNSAIQDSRYEVTLEKQQPKLLKCGYRGCNCLFYDPMIPRSDKCVMLLPDPQKMKEVRNTFNGPALISSLLPPIDHLMGRIGHPALQSGKLEAWKLVCGKVEACEPIPTPLPELRANPKRKEQAQYDDAVKDRQNTLRKYVTQTLEDFENAKSYPGGTKELYKRCFSVYIIERTENSTRIVWQYDVTHKNQKWSEKTASVTTPLPPYLIIGGVATWD